MIEREDNVTFTGQEAEALTEKDLIGAIEMLKKREPSDFESMVDHILENCTEDQLEKLFGPKREGDAKTLLFGFPIYKRKFVPLGEMWIMNRDGRVLQKIRL